MNMNFAISAISLICLSFLIVSSCNAQAEESLFGTKVLPGDYDIGRLIKNIPDSTISYWDIGPNPDIYDEGDVVYLDLKPIGITNANDIRLTAFSSLPPGSKVTSLDNDIGKGLIQFKYPYIGFLNLKGSVLYDLCDPVYIHILTGYFQMTGKFLTMPKASSFNQTQQYCGGFSSKPSYTNGRWVPRGTTVITYTDQYSVIVPDEIANPKPSPVVNCDGKVVEVIKGIKGDYYHILDTEQFKYISRNDASLIENMGLLGKSTVVNTDDIGNLTAAINYITLTSQQTITNDIRLNSIGTFAAGTKVVDFDPDHNKLISGQILVSFPRDNSNLGALRFYDQNGNGQYDEPDDVYMDISYRGNFTTGQVAINDIRLTGRV
jgi:hypothetical protein